MFYGDEIKQEVASRVDIVELISGYVSLKQKGKDYWACCPFHAEKTPSFKVSRDVQLYHCFGCHKAGGVFNFLMEYEGMTYPESIEFLAARVGYQLPEKKMSDAEKKKAGKRMRLLEVNKQAAIYFYYLLRNTEHGKKGLEYYKNRGFTDETMHSFGLGYADIYENDLYKYLKGKGFTDYEIRDAGLCELNEKTGGRDAFWNRVMVPIYDINGKVIAFGGRVLGDGKPKYVNTKATDVFDKSRNLYALHIAKKSKRRGMIMCEGYMDVISLHQAGFDNAVATLGTAVTIGHASLVKRYTDEVYLSYDSDEAGVKAAIKASDIFRQVGISARVVDMRPYKDPDEFIKNLGAEEYEKRLETALPGIMFTIEKEKEKHNLSDPEEKSRFLKEAAKVLATIEDSLTRQSYIDAVATEYGTDKNSLKELVSKIGNAAVEKKIYESAAEQDSYKNRDEVKKEQEGKPEKLLLTWLTREPALFKKLEGVISEEDFTDEPYKTVAAWVFSEFRDKGKVVPANIVNTFEEIEEQRDVANILSTELYKPGEEGDILERERALTDIVKSIKRKSIDKALSTADPVKMSELFKQRGLLDKLEIKL
ncbi:MAG: DNA primase [Lachnospiraceae bacterium]|nr:DNA primase [Lachnospiraceae bacterium]